MLKDLMMKNHLKKILDVIKYKIMLYLQNKKENKMYFVLVNYFESVLNQY
jgi:hypothetical protein